MMVNVHRGGDHNQSSSEDVETSKRAMLMCEACGHTWNSRNTSGKGRHCSDCHSRQIVEVEDVNSPAFEANPKREALVVEKTALPPSLRDDPEVRQKLKELELARLDRQIREVRGYQLSDGLAERLVIRQMAILVELANTHAIDDDALERLISYCPWCEANGEDGMVYEDPNEDHPYRNGYRCNSCGHWVPY